MIEVARETDVFQKTFKTIMSVLFMLTPNFWAEMKGMVEGFLIPEIVISVVLALIGTLCAAVGAAGIAARVAGVVAKLRKAFTAAGAVGKVLSAFFRYIDDLFALIGKLSKALRKKIDEAIEGATGAFNKIVRKVKGSHIPKKKVDEILATAKGKRPDPSTYMSKAAIDAHLKQFDEGAIRFTSRSSVKKYGTAGPSDGFILPRREFDQIMKSSKGDFRIVEQKLGLDPGYLSSSDTMIVAFKPADMKGLRIPSGNEGGANSFWLPGGYTSGGVPEAVMDTASAPFTEIILK